MTSPKDFMTSFAKEIVHNVDTRPQIVQEWTEKLEAREAESRQEFYERFKKNLPLDPDYKLYSHEAREKIIEAARKAARLE